MTRPPLEVADIFRTHGEEFRKRLSGQLSGIQLRAMRAIQQCRTSALGGHLEQCDQCGYRRNAYNSCRNRNCPKCQSTAAKKWLEKRESEILPVPYFHVVFTVPEEITRITLGNRRVLYSILFQSVSQTMLKIGSDPKHLGGQIGFLAILHTWGQTLEFHLHLHCVVAGGALTPDGRWIRCGNNFFLPVAVLSKLFRGKFLAALNRAFRDGNLHWKRKLEWLSNKRNFDAYLSVAAKKQWVVYCKRPFGGPQQVLHYLGRYTHRIAISNSRLISLQKGKVTFRWKDYRTGGAQKLMTLTAHEFIRRFLMHVVPSRFVRIRHYGFLANRNKATSIVSIRESMVSAVQIPEVNASSNAGNIKTSDSFDACPICHSGKMILIEIFSPVQPVDSS